MVGSKKLQTGANSMITLSTLQEHLAHLLAIDKVYFEEGDWDRLDRIRLEIDATREQIEKQEQSK
jgi:hypothetical protein